MNLARNNGIIIKKSEMWDGKRMIVEWWGDPQIWKSQSPRNETTIQSSSHFPHQSFPNIIPSNPIQSDPIWWLTLLIFSSHLSDTISLLKRSNQNLQFYHNTTSTSVPWPPPGCLPPHSPLAHSLSLSPIFPFLLKFSFKKENSFFLNINKFFYIN